MADKEKRLTKSQKRAAYRRAVEATLVKFYDTPAPVARDMVKDWWLRLSATPDVFQSGIFMHSEPMNTAGHLALSEIVPITSDVWPEYEKVLKESGVPVFAPPLRGRHAKVAPVDAGLVRPLLKTQRARVRSSSEEPGEALRRRSRAAEIRGPEAFGKIH